MFKKKPRHNEVDNLKNYDEEITWETSRVEMVERSERRAWKITIAAVCCAVLAIIAIALMMPLKETIPFLIRVDNTTGVPDIITRMDEKAVNFDDAMDKYWLSQYVISRESYDWHVIQKDYEKVGLLSSPRIAEQYSKLFEGKEALDKRYGDRIKVTVKIISVVPDGNGIGTVRFAKETRQSDDSEKGNSTKSKWVATIGYGYNSPSLMRESSRLVNPLGFQVKSYRIDPELAGVTQ